MIKFLFKNRTALQIFLVTAFLLVGYNVTNSIADNVEINTIDGSQNIDDLQIINVNIPQGSSASEISSILDSTGVITSKLAFELYLRNENLTDKLRSGTYEIPNNLNFEELTSVLLKGPPLKTKTTAVYNKLLRNKTRRVEGSTIKKDTNSAMNNKPWYLVLTMSPLKNPKSKYGDKSLVSFCSDFSAISSQA